eukprot:1200762-Alexandrium_andersonii.AAC.1
MNPLDVVEAVAPGLHGQTLQRDDALGVAQGAPGRLDVRRLLQEFEQRDPKGRDQAHPVRSEKRGN